jgi:hypothetical protein
MTLSSHSPIKTEVRRIDGVSIRYAESDARDVSAILLSPWPESLFTFEQMWCRLAESTPCGDRSTGFRPLGAAERC